MTARIEIADAARDELAAAVAWYDARRRGLGADLLAEVQHALDLIARHPRIGAPVPHVGTWRKMRRISVRRFPYAIAYRQRGEAVQIIAFAHHSRRPGYWRTR